MTDLAPDPHPLPDALVPLVVDPETAADIPSLARLVASVETIRDVVNDAVAGARLRLKEVAIADAQSEGVTRRIDGVGQVIVTAPKPTPTVVDEDEFAAWFAERWPDHVGTRTAVTVRPGWQAKVVDALDEAAFYMDTDDPDPLQVLETFAVLVQAIAIDVVTVLPDKPLDHATKQGDLRVRGNADDGYVLADPDGVVVPGVEVRPPRPQDLSIRPDKDARATAAEELREALASRARLHA